MCILFVMSSSVAIVLAYITQYLRPQRASSIALNNLAPQVESDYKYSDIEVVHVHQCQSN